MNRNDLTQKELLQVWWAYTWRLTGLLIGLGIAVGVVCGILKAVTHANFDSLQNSASLISSLLTIPFGIWIFRKILSKVYGDFKLVLLMNGKPLDDDAPLSQKLAELLPLWWAHYWRALLISCGLCIAGIIGLCIVSMVYALVARTAGLPFPSAAGFGLVVGLIFVLIACGVGIYASLIALRKALCKPYDNGLVVQVLRRRTKVATASGGGQ